jgi:hypothetical protein
MKWYKYAEHRILAFLSPESALINSLCQAFLAVRNEASWYNQTHRNGIAGHLAVAADAVEKFMPRRVAAEAGFSSWIAVRERFKQNAIPFREQIVWLATMPQSAPSGVLLLNRFALVVLALGELTRLEEFLKRVRDRALCYLRPKPRLVIKI